MQQPDLNPYSQAEHIYLRYFASLYITFYLSLICLDVYTFHKVFKL